jgi:hypothetical protein
MFHTSILSSVRKAIRFLREDALSEVNVMAKKKNVRKKAGSGKAHDKHAPKKAGKKHKRAEPGSGEPHDKFASHEEKCEALGVEETEVVEEENDEEEVNDEENEEETDDSEEE